MDARAFLQILQLQLETHLKDKDRHKNMYYDQRDQDLPWNLTSQTNRLFKLDMDNKIETIVGNTEKINDKSPEPKVETLAEQENVLK